MSEAFEILFWKQESNVDMDDIHEAVLLVKVWLS